MKEKFVQHTLMLSLFVSLALSARSESGTPITTNAPVVTIVATDPKASETGPDPGEIVVSRSTGTNDSLFVQLHIGGSASNGVDYQLIPGAITIPAGALRVAIAIKPLPDALVEGTETVEIGLAPSPLASLPQYVIGSPRAATVFIEDTAPPVTNLPPEVSISSPTNGASFAAPADIIIFADAMDPDGTVQTVQFFAGDKSLGIVTNNPASASPVNPWHVLWTNVGPGVYVLTAKATDDGGASRVSPPVTITVKPISSQAVVTIVATDPDASEIPVVPPGMERPQLIDPAIFTITRSGSTGFPLTVFYEIGGTASNGVDYGRLPNSVTIPAGASSATIEVDPIDDFLVEETETVIITLQPPICIAIYPPPPDCYLVGSPSRAVAYIHDNDVNTSNVPPTVHIVTPENGATFSAPANIFIIANAIDVDDTVSTVEFFAGDKSLGLRTNLPVMNPIGPFTLTWTNVPPGKYTLTALATDSRGASTRSEPVRIAVVDTNAPPVTNHPPVVTIIATDSVASEGTNFWWWPVTSTAVDWQTAPLVSPIAFRTNWPSINTATFKIRRGDNTNSDLLVYYAISGTASNGVDYENLPGVVTIPAGERSAVVTVIPIDDKLIEPIETVVLTLQLPPDATASILPAYTIGNPRQAAAIIVDNDRPRPPCRPLPDGVFHLCEPGTNGFWYRLEVSADLVNWLPVCTNMVTDGALHFVDPDAKDLPRRYYRTFPEPNPPSD